MSLMVSISGIRGIIGQSLTPTVLTEYTQAYASWLHTQTSSLGTVPTVVLGRDSRPSGHTLIAFVESVLIQSGCNVIMLGLATTPTVELAVIEEQATGGIIISASHNPLEWNALKLLNAKGEFLSSEESQEMLSIYKAKSFHYVPWNGFGISVPRTDSGERHICSMLSLPNIPYSEIRAQNFKVLVDAVNGAGALIIPALCRALGIQEIIEVACKPTGIFPRNPEPIEENLIETQGLTAYHGADIGIVVDPDVDRVCFICEDGTLFGEEYSLVAAADYWLQFHPGPVVSNLSSSRALRDIAAKYEVPYFASKVGEAHVIEMMKAHQAVIGGEGNGGVILPNAHYGRDALVGIVLFLAAFTHWRGQTKGRLLSDFKKSLPTYQMVKRKISLSSKEDIEQALRRVESEYRSNSEVSLTTIDGVKIDFDAGWVHLRKSNTEPILRLYAEGKDTALASRYADDITSLLLEPISNT